MKKIINWFLNPPVTGQSAILIIRLLAGGVFFYRSGRPAAEGRADRDRRDRRVPSSPAVPVRSTPITPSTARSDLITFSRCLRSLISTVMSIRACWSSSVRASMFLMLVLMSAILRADRRQQPLPILDLHRQLDGVARRRRSPLSHSTSMRRSGS